MADITVNIDLSDPDGVERGTDQMKYLVGVALAQPYPSDPLTLEDHLQNVVNPAYGEFGGTRTPSSSRSGLDGINLCDGGEIPNGAVWIDGEPMVTPDDR